jgi:hypothetical protein
MRPVEDLAAFARSRRPIQARAHAALYGSAKRALFKRLRGDDDWADGLVNAAERLLRRRYRIEAGRLTTAELREFVATFRRQLQDTLDKTHKPPKDEMEMRAERLAASISNSAINAGYHAAGIDHEDLHFKKWVTMHDDRVRHEHADVDGQTVPVGSKFSVGGHRMDYPGDTSAPIDLWINCRCVVALTKESTVTASLTEKVDLVVRDENGTEAWRGTTEVPASELDDFDEADFDGAQDDDDLTVPWHGILAPENVASGDKRKFGTDSLRWRDLPLPLAYQKTTATGHDGSVVVGRIDEVWKEDGMVKASGVFLSTSEADEAVGMLAEGAIRGVSVDVDDATLQMEDQDGNPVEATEFDDNTVMNFTSGRICGATLCAIPAFAEAFVSLGEWALDAADGEALTAGCECEVFISEEAWDGSASNYTDEQYYKATIVHLVDSGPDRLKKSNNKLPILTPSGQLSRAGVHAAVSRLGSTDAPAEKIDRAKAALRTAYRELKEDVPDTIKAASDDLDEFETEFDYDEDFVKTEDGPGWLTHPADTERLRRYWTKGKGAAKIRWGTPGDFNRCRRQLAKYVKPQFLSGYCANRHYDATGFWPGDAPTEGGKGKHSGATAPAVNLVASATEKVSARYFDNPGLTAPTPITVTDDGRIFGHVATWGTCHIGIKGTCVTAPHSESDYAYFRVGAVHTDEGDIAVGHVTLGTGHAGPRLSASSAAAHYDNTGTVAADVVAGEDASGIWISGRVRDHLSDEDRHALAAAPLSGDWRGIAGNLEMVAALAVNVGGFPIPRTTLAASGGEQTSLVAAGIMLRTDSTTELAAAVMAAVDEIEARNRRRRMAQVAKRTGRDPKSRMAALAANVRGE